MYHLIACQYRPRSRPDRPPVIILSDDEFRPCWERAKAFGSRRDFNDEGAVIVGNLPVWAPSKGDPWIYWIVRQD